MVPVAPVDQIDRVMDFALRVDFHAHLFQTSIIGSIVPATVLDDQYCERLRSFLEQDCTANLFGLGVLERWGTARLANAEWWGVFDAEDQLQGACYAGEHRLGEGYGLVVPFGTEGAAQLLGIALGARGGARWVVGDRAASDALWAGLGSPAFRLCTDQVLFEATSVTAGPYLSLRNGGASDRMWVHGAAAGMVQEDLGLKWAGWTPEQFATQVEYSLREGNEFLGELASVRVYRVKRGTVGVHGAQIGGIWVDPAMRGRGLGQAGTRAMTAMLLEQVPRVTLHVRADNYTAARCYEAVGYQAVRAFRLLVR
jgi:ribosomal protein S18 acetylase RimI-like enzyme